MLEPGSTTPLLEAALAEICANCGEAYVAEEVGHQILAAELAARSGVQVDVREFVGATELKEPRSPPGLSPWAGQDRSYPG
jgi:hypothetical protein